MTEKIQSSMEPYELIISNTVLLYPCAVPVFITRVSPVNREVCLSTRSGIPKPHQLPVSLLFPLEVLAVHCGGLNHIEDSLSNTKVSVSDRT